MAREIERWVTLSGRRVPIFKRAANITKAELKKQIYKTGTGTWMLDLPKGWSSDYGNYIESNTKKDLLYELETNVSPNYELEPKTKSFKLVHGKSKMKK